MKNNRSERIFSQIQKEFSRNPEEVIDKYMFLSCLSVLKGISQRSYISFICCINISLTLRTLRLIFIS